MIYIESKDNKLYKELKKLKSKRFRQLNNKYLIEGYRFVEEALKSKSDVLHIVVALGFYEKNKEDKLLRELDHSLLIIKDSLFNELCDTETPQGILAEVKLKINSPVVEDGLYILADKLQDPGNLGTIIRTAEAVGAKGVICTKGTVDYLNEKVLRSTMGSVFRMQVILEEENLTFTKLLKSKGYKLIGTSLQTDKSIYDFNLSGNIVICIGNEASGISDEIMSLCDYKAIIPMVGEVESLNASVAASVIMFEALRQRL